MEFQDIFLDLVVVDQPITDPISGSSLDFLKTCLRVNQDVREDPDLDIIRIPGKIPSITHMNHSISRLRDRT